MNFLSPQLLDKLNERISIEVNVYNFRSIKWENFYKKVIILVKILTCIWSHSIIVFDFVGSVLVEETKGYLSTWTARRSACGGSGWMDFWSHLWERRGKREVNDHFYLLRCYLSLWSMLQNQFDGQCVRKLFTFDQCLIQYSCSDQMS